MADNAQFYSSTADRQRAQLQSAGHEPVLLVAEWASICMCLPATFRQAATYIRELYTLIDIGITTETTSDVSTT